MRLAITITPRLDAVTGAIECRLVTGWGLRGESYDKLLLNLLRTVELMQICWITEACLESSLVRKY